MKIFIGSGSGSEHKVCSYQSTIVYNFFDINGYQLIKSAKGVDYIILNGYPFEEFEERINLLTINYYLIKYPNAKIILIGSIPGMMPYMSEVDRVILIGLKNLGDFDTMFEHTISIKDTIVDNVKFFVPLNIESLNIDSYGYQDKNIESKYVYSDEELKFGVKNFNDLNFDITRIEEYDNENINYIDDLSGEYAIEICTGCGGYCTYCDIRNIAGFVKSIPLAKVIQKIERGISLGFKEFHFIDEDSASYGLDIGIDFADLLNEINKIEGEFKIKIFYFEPGRLEKLYKKIDIGVWNKIVNFCVPIQTTSQRVLKLMNRHYDIESVLKIVDEIKIKNKYIYISTQFIYGFPTETFDEFREYFKVINNFDIIWFYYYSDRHGAQATKFTGKIVKSEMKKRMIFLWKIKERFPNKVFDKNESLKQGLNILKNRKV